MRVKKFILSLTAMCWMTVMHAEVVHHLSSASSINQRGFTQECWEDTDTDKLYADADCTQELNAAEVITYTPLAIDPVIFTEGFTAKKEGTYKSSFINTTTLQWPVDDNFERWDTDLHVAEFIVCGSEVQHARLKWLKDIGYCRYGRFNVKVYVNGHEVYALEQREDEDLSGVFSVPLPGLKTRDVVRLEVCLLEGSNLSTYPTVIAACLEYTREDDKAALPLVLQADDKEKILGEADPALTWHCVKGTMTYGNPMLNLTRDEGEAPGKYTIYDSAPVSANPNYAIVFINGTLTINGVVHHSASQITLSQRGYACECWEDLVTGYYYSDAGCKKRISEAEVFGYVKLMKDPYIDGVGFKSYESSLYGNNQFDWAVETVYLLDETDTRFAEFEVYGADVKNARIKWYKDNMDWATENTLLVSVFVNGELVYRYDKDDRAEPLLKLYSAPLPDLKTGDRVRFEVTKLGNEAYIFNSNTVFAACLEYERSGIAYIPLTIRALSRDKLVGEKDRELLWSIEQGSTLPGYNLGDIKLTRDEGEDPGRYTIHASKGENTHPAYDITFREGTFIIMTPEEADYTEVATLEELRAAVNATDNPRIKLTDDIYLNGMRDTLRSSFTGTLDGDGHAIVGSAGGRVKCVPLFSDAVGALIQNLTFKDIRIDSEDNNRLGAIAANLTDCNVKNVTTVNMSVWTDLSNAGTIAGHAEGCYFENVQVKGGDVTVDSELAGGIVGSVIHCHFINCTTDERTSVFADGNDDPHFQEGVCGGLVGSAKYSEFTHCVNRAIVGGDYQYLGGIVGYDHDCKLSHCINVGLVLSIDGSDFGPLSERYRRGELPRNTYRYGGEEYSPQYLTADDLNLVDTDGAVGGIEGYGDYSQVTDCVNFGPFYSKSTNIVNSYGVGGIIGHAFNSHVESCANFGFNAKEGAEYTGGIVGEADGAIINNCFNATASAYGSTDSNGSIVGKVLHLSKVNNCLSAVAHRMVGDDWSFHGSANNDFIDPTSGNNYRLEADNETNQWEVLVNSQALESGVVARWLNNGKENLEQGVAPWRQTLQAAGDKTKDNTPVLDATHDEVTLDQIDMTLIRTADDLKAFALNVNAGNQFACAALDNDIDMAGVNDFTPIGLDEAKKHFRGIFDGRGHTIQNLKVNTDKAVGLFGAAHVGAEIRNVIIGDGCEFTSTSDQGAGAILGTAHINWNWGTVVIENCGNYGKVNGKNNAGGIFGRMQGDMGNDVKAYINNCFSVGTITAEQGNSGLIGGYLRDNGVITNCWSTGNLVSSTWDKPFDAEHNEFFAGYDNKIDIQNCYALSPYENVQGAGMATIQSGVKNHQAVAFANGEITYYLNGKTNDTANAFAWQQDLDTDPHPVFGSQGLYYTRAISGKDYGTICVPYPLESLKGVGADKRDYYLFKEVKDEGDGTVSLCFEYTDVVPAGTPALFSVTVNGDYEFLSAGAECQFAAQATAGTDWTFTGTYEQRVFEGEAAKSIYYIDGTMNNSAIRNAKKTTINPYRAYFVGPNIETLTNGGNGAPARVRLVIDGEESETAALQLVVEDGVLTTSGKSYTLFGTEADENYRGIVVREGKKQFIGFRILGY